MASACQTPPPEIRESFHWFCRFSTFPAQLVVPAAPRCKLPLAHLYWAWCCWLHDGWTGAFLWIQQDLPRCTRVTTLCASWGICLDGEEEVGSGVYVLSPARTAKCWRELARERGGGGGDSLVPLQIDKRQEEVTITLCSCPSVVRWSQWKRRVGSAPWHCPACQEPSGRDSDLGHPCAVFCMKGRGKGVWDVSACDSFTGRAGGYEAVSVLMGRWQRSDRTYSIAATRGVSAWAVSVKLGQPAEELGLQLQHSPFMGNLQGAKLRLQQGGMKIPKAGA